jgi:hypothetical protein
MEDPIKSDCGDIDMATFLTNCELHHRGWVHLSYVSSSNLSPGVSVSTGMLSSLVVDVSE